MLTLPLSVYLADEPVDLRCGHDGPCTLVVALGGDPYAGHLFVGRRRDRVKILFWDHGEFGLYYKRLKRGPADEYLESRYLLFRRAG